MRLLAFVLMFFAITAGQPADAKRVALVIGNSDYQHATRLANPSADAQLIGETLTQAGFDSVDIAYDLGLRELERALRDFGLRAEGADVALVYYAGHGIEAGGQNYLIPVDAELERDRDLEIEATRLETALSMVSGGQMKIVILDACRNNPFAARMVRTFKTRSIGRGLAAIEPEGETLVVYAAKAGATAADGEGSNSPFAESLAERLPEQGLEISLLFRRVRDDVLRKTGGYQEPFTYGSLSGRAFYFVPEVESEVVRTGSVSGPSMSAEVNEGLYWQGTVNANTESAYRSYLTEYPEGRYAGLAEQNIERINAPPAQVPGIGVSFASFQNVINPGAGSAANRIITDADTLRQFAFTPSEAVRDRAKQDVLTRMSGNNAQIAVALEMLFKQQDIFALLQNDAFDEYDMSVNNIADAFSAFIYAMHDVANGQVIKATPEQALGMRNQAAKLLILSPGSVPEDPAKRQEMSDNLLLSSVALMAIYEIAKSDPASLKRVSDEIQKQALTMMSLDLRGMTITDQGLTPIVAPANE